METKSPSGRRRPVSLREIKWLIFTLGLTGTILLWNLFSKQMNQDTAASSTVAANPTQPVAGLVLEFPPLPTLVPYQSQPVSVGVKQNLVPTPAQVAPTPAPVAQPQVQVPVKVILSRAAPRAAAPAPVARTSSSH